MKVLVTGGAGYIGSVVVEQLIERSYQVVVFDNLTKGHRKAVHPDAEFIKGDLKDDEKVSQVFQDHQPNAVMHFASNSLVGESMEHPFLYLGDNVICAINLLQAASRYGTERFILSSSANLYGDPQSIPITEEEQIEPGSPYGESKNIIERMLMWLDHLDILRYASLRYFNAAGATEKYGEHHDQETHLIPLVLQVARGLRESISIFGDDYPTKDGTCIRDYIHVIDLAEAHILALQQLESHSMRYNLGSGKGYSVREVIQTAREVTGHPIPEVVGDRRPGDPAILVASSGAIQRDLGWEPKFDSLDDIITSAWKWHLAHPQGYTG